MTGLCGYSRPSRPARWPGPTTPERSSETADPLVPDVTEFSVPTPRGRTSCTRAVLPTRESPYRVFLPVLRLDEVPLAAGLLPGAALLPAAAFLPGAAFSATAFAPAGAR